MHLEMTSNSIMRVLVNSGNAPAYGGVGVYTKSLMTSLQEFCGERIEVLSDTISKSATDWRSLHRLQYLARLARLRHHGYNNAQLVHFTNYYVPKRVRGIASVANIYDLDPLFLPDAHSWRYREYFKYIVAKAVKRSHLIISSSEVVREEIINCFHANPERIVTIGVGLLPAFESLAFKEERSTPSTPVLLMVGQLHKKKNTAWFVRTVSSGVKNGALPKMQILLAGRPGYGFAEVEPMLRENFEVVRWIQNPNLAELVRLYCTSSVVAIPSLREGFGIPLLESMYCDKPIVASRIPSTMEIAGDVPYYFDLGSEDSLFNAIKEALRDPFADKRRFSSRERLERYSWSNLALRHERVYRSALHLSRSDVNGK